MSPMARLFSGITLPAGLLALLYTGAALVALATLGTGIGLIR